jgi:Macrocin-O-methyltransferase (TylF)
MNDCKTINDAAQHGLRRIKTRPTRIICYAWGRDYVDILLSLTLPSLLAPGNLPFVAAEAPCSVVILTERRFFAEFDAHPVIERIRQYCPIRLLKLDDLLVSSDKYGMSLTYVLHRGFSDLGPEMTNQWQIFLNADFILANGSLRSLMTELSNGSRIVASPSYCVNAEAAIPELRQRLNPENSSLSISHRELASLILKHRHTVIRGKTVNQQQFHMRYMDQFYWGVDKDTLIGLQMPVAIVGLHPERYVDEPSSYWDYGLIREYCPTAEISVLADSDQFTMLELRKKVVAEDQIVPGPPDMAEIAQRMVTWVTPYQRDFLKYPLTLHALDRPSNIDDECQKLQAYVDKIMALAPTFPSHIKHPQWEYHWAAFRRGRRTFVRIWKRIRLLLIAPLRISAKALFTLWSRALIAGKRVVKSILRYLMRPIIKRVLVPALRRRELEIVATAHLAVKEAQIDLLIGRIHELIADVSARDIRIIELLGDVSARDNVVAEYQFKLERSYDYQAIMEQDQIRHGLAHLDPEFLALYERCREYTMTSWERLYALYVSVRYVIENGISGDFVECGVWRGGSMKLVAHVLLSLGATKRNLVLYDTFEGMTKPDAGVDIDYPGNKAIDDWTELQHRGVKWSYAPIEEVQATMAQVGYPMDRIQFIKGPVEETIPGRVPQKIALLRLDTDWYASTKHEMENLYPLLSPEGVLILDDYGHYRGAAQAVDEYLATLPKKPMLQRIDYSCRLAIKPCS